MQITPNGNPYLSLEGHAVKNDIIKYVKFCKTARWIQFYDKTSEFIINVEDLDDNYTTSYRFDTLIIATGHGIILGMPYIDGLVTFKDPVLHSYHFRDPHLFEGNCLLII
jgi:cation diffusion facilitator CzcD-associated flavoprotein CzcO